MCYELDFYCYVVKNLYLKICYCKMLIFDVVAFKYLNELYILYQYFIIDELCKIMD